MQDFVHLHVHTQYSILDGQASVSRLVDKAMKDGMRGMAITDHGNMMAIKEFFNYTTKKNSGTNADIKMWKKRIALLENGEDAALKEWVDGQKKKQKEADEQRRRAEANDRYRLRRISCRRRNRSFLRLPISWPRLAWSWWRPGNVCSNRYSVVKCMWRLVVWIRWKKKRTAGGII